MTPSEHAFLSRLESLLWTQPAYRRLNARKNRASDKLALEATYGTPKRIATARKAYDRQLAKVAEYQRAEAAKLLERER